MAAMDVIISKLLDQLFLVIGSEVELHRNFKNELENLDSNLKEIKLLLDYAERNQLRDPLTKSWVDEFRDKAYDVEDLLDNLETTNRALLPSEQEEVENPRLSVFKKVWISIQTLLSCFKHVIENRTTALEIKNLNKILEKIYDEGKNKLRLVPKTESREERFKKERITTSGIIKPNVHGRENDKKEVKKMLLRYYKKENNTIPVVSIVGQGGLGKTTLARMVYNDMEVQREFPVRIWICISEPFDEIRIFREILEQLTKDSTNISSPETLTKKIEEFLQKEPKLLFLLVLDDVWTEDHTKWQSLNACLCHGAEGSKILVTTRKHKTSDAFDASEVHGLQPMSNGDCWSIISQLALFNRNEMEIKQLEPIGKKIVEKCDGLPLAAHVLGGLLRNKTNVQEWQRVLDSEVWELENVENKIFRHLFLSYDELEPSVKRCFSYCAVFPKDSKIDVNNMIRMWMAQGFLPSGERLEEMDYFMVLNQHSFFQDLEKGYGVWKLSHAKYMT